MKTIGHPMIYLTLHALGLGEIRRDWKFFIVCQNIWVSMNLAEIRSTTLYQTNLPYCVSKAFLTCYVTKGLLLCVSKSEFTVTIGIFYCICLLTLGLRHSVRKKVYLIIALRLWSTSLCHYIYRYICTCVLFLCWQYM